MRCIVDATLSNVVLLAGVTPPASADPCGTYDGKGCAPLGRRVDLAAPQFSNPTSVTNPLFPVSRLRSVVLLGHVEGRRFRTETTLLPSTGTVTLGGRTVRVLFSQYLAYRGSNLEEVALEGFAQAVAGSVFVRAGRERSGGTSARTSSSTCGGQSPRRRAPGSLDVTDRPR